MTRKKRALIIGVSSQDGSYLADLLLSKNYTVIGTIRRTTSYEKENIAHLKNKIIIESVDLIDSESINRVVKKYIPDEIYNVAAQSVPADSWSHPIYTGEVTAMGPVRVFEAARSFAPKAKIYQATSREIFGNIQQESANESTPIDANNPYGIAKAYAHMMANCYRESYGMFIASGILFNHESPRRSLHFVTRKVAAAVACIKNKVKNIPLNEAGEPLIDNKNRLHLGWLDASRDWGYAKEYVVAMHKMLQQKTPKDYIIGTNTTHTIRELCQIAFGAANLDWQKHVISDPVFVRPTEIKELKGDYSRAKKDLKWEPETSFKQLIKLMVKSDLKKFT